MEADAGQAGSSPAASSSRAASPAASPASSRASQGVLSEGLGLSSWMASPAELQAAAMAAAGEPVPTGDAGPGFSWKRWAGRRDGQEEYQGGDLLRGMFSGAATSVADSVREAKHNLANAKLSLRETVEQKAREQVSSLLSKDGEAEVVEARSERPPVAERWWTEACQRAHRHHDPQDDAPRWHEGGGGGGSASTSRGHLEVQFLSADLPKGKLPVCQLSLEGCQSGGLSPKQPYDGGDQAEDQGDQPPLVSSVRFAVQEVAGCDLRVNVFDKGSFNFMLGSEHRACYGGSFMPLSLIVEKGKRCAPDAAQPLSVGWEAEFTLRLLPLELLRLKRKLEPARPGGMQRPEEPLGSVVLAVKLVLRAEPSWAAPVTLRTAEPFLGAQQQASFQNLSEPLTFISDAGATLERMKRALVFDQEDLRREPAFAAILHAWWLYLSLLAPPWAWPPLFAAVVPLYGLSLQAALRWPLGLEAPRLFDAPVERVERKDSKLNVKEKVQSAMQDAAQQAAQGHANLRGFFQTLSHVAATLEKVKFVLAVGDPYTSLICMAVVLVVACSASVAIVVLGSFCSYSWLPARLALWAAGSYALLPGRARVVIDEFGAHLYELQKKYTGDRMSRRLKAFWARVPDVVEAAHLELCRKEALKMQ